ncbi:hypothetical protein DBR32_08220 [Taibaiella sp. KBW10]|uniref:outer membrane beta-barrel protein n=1 Tax=Taibaiella sp. KBW10 TaxID=2153357 RepID=UPI000F5B7CF5|nr:outer membrane beta-barrel protein [Taibaiella sp. KBW10]RQO30705.1 hypothetical protein DBR32_08220 [Taibaiella sp. KBW10]
MMIKNTKLTLLALTATLMATQAQAQFAVGLHGGAAISRTDATPNGTNAVYGLNGQYDALRYLSIRLNAVHGTLSGGDKAVPANMYYENNFYQADLNLKFYPVGIMKQSRTETSLYYLSKIYAGVGIGVLNNNTKIHNVVADVFNYKGNYKGTDYVVPVEFGIDIPLSRVFSDKGLSLNLNYRINYCGSDKVDGYDPNLASNKSKDVYNAATLGISYKF